MSEPEPEFDGGTSDGFMCVFFSVRAGPEGTHVLEGHDGDWTLEFQPPSEEDETAGFLKARDAASVTAMLREFATVYEANALLATLSKPATREGGTLTLEGPIQVHDDDDWPTGRVHHLDMEMDGVGTGTLLIILDPQEGRGRLRVISTGYEWEPFHIIRRALRDAPPRTKSKKSPKHLAGDPNFWWDGPESSQMRLTFCRDALAIATPVDGTTRLMVLRSRDDRPQELMEFHGTVRALAPLANSDQVAIVQTSTMGEWSSTRLDLIDLVTGDMTEGPRLEANRRVVQLVSNPEGDAIAFGLTDPDPHAFRPRTETCVWRLSAPQRRFGFRSRSRIERLDTTGLPAAWGAEGLVLTIPEAHDIHTASDSWCLWNGPGGVTSVMGEGLIATSTDWRARLTLEDGRPIITTPTGSRPVILETPAQERAFTPPVQLDDALFGTRLMLSSSDRPIALDLETGRIHPLLPRGKHAQVHTMNLNDAEFAGDLGVGCDPFRARLDLERLDTPTA